MKISELFLVPEFHDFRLLAGRDYLDKEITSVNVIDSPDIYKFFRGGEFLLTAAFIMKDDPGMFLDILDNAAKMGVACMGVKLERYIDKLPEEVADFANQQKFPIISIPTDYRFVDILNPVYRDIINKQVRKLSFSEKVHKSFTQLVLSGGSIQQIVAILSSLLGREVIYYDLFFSKIYHSEYETPRETEDFPSLSELLSHREHHQIELDNRHFGYLIFGKRKDRAAKSESPVEYQNIAIEHAATVLKLNIQKSISNQQIESKYHDIFVQELLTHQFSSLEEIQLQASFYHKNLPSSMAVIVFDHLNLPKSKSLVIQTDEITTRIKTRLHYRFKQLIYTKIGSQIIFLISSPYEDLKLFRKEVIDACTAIRNEVKELLKEQLIVGIGNYKISLLELHQSYEEACQAITVGREIDCPVCSYSDMGLYRLLGPLSGSENAQQFQERFVDPLIHHDQRYGSYCLLTVKTLVAENWNLKATSQKMFVHYNTIKNRYRKINEILELDMDDVENRLNIHIALKLLLLSDKK